ncbi:MAG: PTS transporter subunit EIIA, partial [Nitrospiraceae bacterium]|nr:PTS transporter subunit EIIA [Nitrospiraceae bacterium]
QGKATLWVSMAGMVVPFVMGFGLAYLLPGVLGFDASTGQMLPFALFLGIAMSITALPVIAKILMDLNMFRSDMGMLIMSSAMVNDLLGWIGFAIVLALVAGAAATGGDPGGIPGGVAEGSATMSLAWTIGLTFAFLGLMLTLGRWLVHRSLPFIQANSAWPGGVLGFVLTITLICAAATEAIGIHSIFGAFIAGIAIGDSRHLRQQTRQTIEQFINNIFAPLFFAGIGLRVNFIAGFDIITVAIVLIVAILGKLVGCYYGAKWAGLSRRESAAIGMGMSARGAMEIILAQLAMAQGLITEKLFVAIVVMAIATSLTPGLRCRRSCVRSKKRRLPDIISDKLFVHRLKGRTAHAVIEELSAVAAEATGLPAPKIADAVWNREQILSTGLPNALAVPHARLAELEKSCLVIGLSEPGIDFDAQDGKPAEVIALLLTPLADGEAQLELLAMVAEAFETPESHASVMAAANFTEFKAALMVSNARSHS